EHGRRLLRIAQGGRAAGGPGAPREVRQQQVVAADPARERVARAPGATAALPRCGPAEAATHLHLFDRTPPSRTRSITGLRVARIARGSPSVHVLDWTGPSGARAG